MSIEQIKEIMNGNALLETGANLYEYIGREDGKTEPVTIDGVKTRPGRKGTYIFSDITNGYPIWATMKELVNDQRYAYCSLDSIYD